MPHAFLRDDRGQALVEYSLVLALLALLAIVAMKLVGPRLDQTLRNAVAALS